MGRELQERLRRVPSPNSLLAPRNSQLHVLPSLTLMSPKMHFRDKSPATEVSGQWAVGSWQ
jgi:hypothetical protein